MGLDIGIISIKLLERPRGKAYQFAWILAEEANVNGYMGGDGNCWGAFTRGQVQNMLDELAQEKHLSPRRKAKIWAWVESLPWEDDGIELYFNW